MRKLVLYGASYPEPVKLIHRINASRPSWELVGFIDDVKAGKQTDFMGFPILGGEAVIPELQARYGDALLFCNNVFSSTRTRAAVTAKMECYGVKYATLISPDVDTALSTIGEGSMIMPGVCIGTNAKIGRHVAIRLGSIVNHDNEIDDLVFIGPGVTLCGRVRLLEGAYIGAGAVVREDVVVGRFATVGLGAGAVRDVADGETVVGTPARPIKKSAAT
jgi:sugar O-acyltransferase (sialic acid O-acetyltransferase NeuD family)